MRLTGFEALADARTAAPRVRDALAPKLSAARAVVSPWIARAQGRLAPARDWLAGEIARSATLTKALAAVAGTWTTLVDSFCATIDPYLSRWFPDLRLVATLMPSGELALTRTLKSDATFLGAPAALDDAARAALASARWTAVELRLREDQVLAARCRCRPRAASFLASIIAHKLERLTPWRPRPGALRLSHRPRRARAARLRSSFSRPPRTSSRRRCRRSARSG